MGHRRSLERLVKILYWKVAKNSSFRGFCDFLKKGGALTLKKKFRFFLASPYLQYGQSRIPLLLLKEELWQVIKFCFVERKLFSDQESSRTDDHIEMKLETYVFIGTQTFIKTSGDNLYRAISKVSKNIFRMLRGKSIF